MSEYPHCKHCALDDDLTECPEWESGHTVPCPQDEECPGKDPFEED